MKDCLCDPSISFNPRYCDILCDVLIRQHGPIWNNSSWCTLHLRGDMRSNYCEAIPYFLNLSPIVTNLYLETLGGLHQGAVSQVKLLGSALARCKGMDEGEAIGQLFGRISLTLMKANALMLSSRCQEADFPSPSVDGILWGKGA